MDVEGIRARLLRRREELRVRSGRASADMRHQDEPLSADFAEQVTQRENDDVLGAISATADNEIILIGQALRRLDEGTYGVCERCGVDIEPERMQAVPYADRCTKCADTGPGRAPSRG